MTKMNEKDMQEVNGGSWVIPEEDGKAAGLTLVNDDGSPGSWERFITAETTTSRERNWPSMKRLRSYISIRTSAVRQRPLKKHWNTNDNRI